MANRDYPSRYDYGSKLITHRGVQVRTSLNTDFEEILKLDPTNHSYEDAVVIQEVEKRPDTISQVMYGSPAYYWFLQVYNNISDSIEGFNIGDRLLIPELDD